MLERLDAAGLLQTSNGAEVVFPPGFTNRDGEPLPLIVRSSAGAYTYATSDLACVADRVERIKADTLVYVVGAPQAQHLAMVFAVSTMAGWLVPPTEAVHVPFGSVLGPDRKMLKSRSGEPARFIDVVNEAIERGVAVVGEKNPDLPPEQQAAIGHAVGIGALKYADLSTDRNPRLHLRLGSHAVVRRQHGAVPAVRPHPGVLAVPSRRGRSGERAFDRADGRGRGRAGPRHPPARLRHRRRRVGRAVQRRTGCARTSTSWPPTFTAFYEHCPVLRADDQAQRDSRLALCDLTARVLAHGLGLLGIDAPEQM